MRDRRRSGSLSGMKKTILAIAAAATLVAAVPASAGSVPQTPGGVKCHQKVKKTYRLGQVKRRGLAVKVTCDGPLKILVMPDFDASSDAQTELAETYGGGSADHPRPPSQDQDHRRPRHDAHGRQLLERPRRLGALGDPALAGDAPRPLVVVDAREQPLAVLVALAADLAREGEPLEPGDLLLAETAGRIVRLQADDQARDPVADLEGEVRRRGAHELAHVVHRDRTAQSLGLLVLGHVTRLPC
jgi:hypothetical protein